MIFVSGAKYLGYMHYSWRIALSVIVRKVCHAICEAYVDETMTAPTSPDEWKQLAHGFLAKWNIPNCVAAIVGKHVAIRKSSRSGSLYYNCKGFLSIILLAIVDSDYKFVWSDLGG